jgi:hypothetical protein
MKKVKLSRARCAPAAATADKPISRRPLSSLPRPSSENDIGPPSPPYREGGGGPSFREGQVVFSNSEQIEQLVQSLTDADKKVLLDRLALDQRFGNKSKDKSREIAMWAVAVGDALTAALGAEAAGLAGSELLRRLLGAVGAWGPVESFMQYSKLADLPVAQRQAAYRLLAELLVSHARKAARYSRVPLSAKFVGNCTVNLAGCFENAFPGYLQAGLAKVVATKSLAAKP